MKQENLKDCIFEKKPVLEITLPLYKTFRKRDAKTKEMKNVETLIALNWYRNAHFQILNKTKKEYHNIISKKVNQSCKLINPPFHVSYKLYIKRKGTDGGNVRSIIEKFTLDALIECGILKDDSIDFIVSDNAEYFYEKENPRCEILFYQIS